MWRLSLNANVHNCFLVALALHAFFVLLSIFSGSSSSNNPLIVPALDSSVRVIFSPFKGNSTPCGNLPVASQKKKSATLSRLVQKKRAKNPSSSIPLGDKRPPQKAKTPAKKQPILPEPKQKKNSQITQKSSERVTKKSAEKASEQKDPEVVPTEIVVGRAQYEEYRIAGEIRSAIERIWVAPRGAQSDERCVLAVEIDACGSVKKIETRVSSGSALFDSAARYAASQTSYPKEAWGKTVLIEFTP